MKVFSVALVFASVAFGLMLEIYGVGVPVVYWLLGFVTGVVASVLLLKDQNKRHG